MKWRFVLTPEASPKAVPPPLGGSWIGRELDERLCEGGVVTCAEEAHLVGGEVGAKRRQIGSCHGNPKRNVFEQL